MTLPNFITPFMTPLLAVQANVDGWSIFQLIFSALVSVVLVRLEMSQRRFDRMEDDRDRKVASVERKLNISEDEKHRLVEKLVDQRLREISHKISNEANTVLLSLKELREKIHETEKDFDVLNEGKHKLEVETLERVMELKDNSANKLDLREHQKTVDAKFGELHERINRLSDRVVTKDDLTKALREAVQRG